MHAGSLSNKLLSHISNNYFILSQKEKNFVISQWQSNIVILYVFDGQCIFTNYKPKELSFTHSKQ